MNKDTNPICHASRLCFYHKADLDGVASAAVVRRFVPDIDLIGIDYGEPFPLVKLTQPWMTDPQTGEKFPADVPQRPTVYMVDFSLPWPDMERLAQLCDLIWIDHHKSAIECADKSSIAIKGARNSRLAACELTWNWFMEPGNMPPEIRLLGRYDVWAKDDPAWESRIVPFQYGCRVRPGIYDPAALVWIGIAGGTTPDGSMVIPADVEAVITTGRDILAYLHQKRAAWAERGAFVTSAVKNADHFFNGRFLCINSQGNNSLSLEFLWDPEQHDVMVVYFQRKDGKWQHGFYSTKPEIDCSQIAVAFGGGGHRGAAGCIVDKPLVQP